MDSQKQYFAASSVKKIAQKQEQSISLKMLRLLQQASIIPKIKAIKLKTPYIYYDNQNSETSFQSYYQSRKLMISQNFTIAYTLVSALGKPTDTDGIIIFPDGAIYKGSLRQGTQQGFGKLENKQLMYSYQGQWKQGMPYGKGTQIISKNMYQGSFKNGKKHGKGTLTFQDGTVFAGIFKENVIDGFGKMKFQNYTWKGFWRNGYLEGQGTQTIKDKKGFVQRSDKSQQQNNKGKQSIYLGGFCHGQRQGFGKFRWDQNREYQGNFKRGQLHGEGILKLGFKVFRGVWELGNDIQMKQVGAGSNSRIQLKRFNKTQQK